MKYVILDFLDQNWNQFIEHCLNHGIPEEEIEEETNKVLKEETISKRRKYEPEESKNAS